MSTSAPFLSMQRMSKHFGGVRALDEVDLEARSGEVLALVGENGAGKSTLMNLLGGVVHADQGSMAIDSAPYAPRNPRDALRVGISFIHQELTLSPSLTVAENIYIGGYPKRMGLVDHRRIDRDAESILARLGVEVDARAPVRELSIGDQQLVEIARALSNDVRLIIFDEPTSSLSVAERDLLFAVIRGLRDNGTAVIYISHFMREIFEISDRISVMRDGRNVGTLQTAEANVEQVIRMMVGKELEGAITRETPPKHEEAVRVSGLTRDGYLEDVSFVLHRGEILGIWGLLGSGRSELARAVFGLDPVERGEVMVDGVHQVRLSPTAATRAGIGYVPENRRADGLVLDMNVRENITMASLRHVTRGPFGWLIRSKEEQMARRQMDRMGIVASGTEHKVDNLSGGNQQKVVLGKWLALGPDVYILDEPTRGVDVGAKDEIQRTIVAVAEAGASVLLISSEMEEILRLSDRILIMRRGEIVREVLPEEASQEQLLKYGTGGI